MNINNTKNEMIISIIYAVFLIPIYLLFSNNLITSNFSLHFVYSIFTIIMIIIFSTKKCISSFKSLIKITIIYSILSCAILYLISIFLAKTMEPLGIGIMINVLFFYNYLYLFIGILFSYLIAKIKNYHYFQKKN